MPQALTAASAPTGIVREERAAFAGANAHKAPRHDIKELDMVRLLVEVTTEDGGRLLAGS
ncbi:MAG: hypothetical protein H0X36_07275 [Sphingomonadaceae bacterium]|nr:hypothetical protein [Sphingomonadaceae bacterium]